MDDIVDELDRLYVAARSGFLDPDCSPEAYSDRLGTLRYELEAKWPILRDRLRLAEVRAAGFTNIAGTVARWEREERCQSTSAMEVLAELVQETHDALHDEHAKGGAT